MAVEVLSQWKSALKADFTNQVEYEAYIEAYAIRFW